MFTYIIVKKNIDNTNMWHNDIRVNSIDMVVLIRRFNERSGRAGGWNTEVKRARGVVWGWVTDRKVLKIQTKKPGFDLELNVISIKNDKVRE